MATYLELHEMYHNQPLLERVEVSLLVVAQGYLDATTPTTEQKKWARFVLNNPREEGYRVLKYLLAKNKALSVAAIEAVTDAQLQTQVEIVIPQFVAGYSGV